MRRNGLAVVSGERAEASPARPLAHGRNDATLGFLLREAVKLARGRRDPTLVWLLHKCAERVPAESTFHPSTLDKSAHVKHTKRVDDSGDA